ncbi:hypothetical protein EVA_20216 [gut metagenome]|uniref:Uncharacterized protein n=1 Tax=gut metagenome TaxID=749906 RepID=J9F9T8_9ZZZZ
MVIVHCWQIVDLNSYMVSGYDEIVCGCFCIRCPDNHRFVGFP